jgi:hypothetical protein
MRAFCLTRRVFQRVASGGRFHVLDLLRGLPEEQIWANCGPKNGDHGRPECRTCGKRRYEKAARHFPPRNMHDHDGPKIGKQAERQPLKNGDVARILNEDLEHHAQNTREHDIQEMRPPNQQAQGIAHRSEIGANVNRVRDKEETDDGVQQPSGIMIYRQFRARSYARSCR